MRAHEAGALHAEGYGGPPLYLPYPTDVMELLPQLWAASVGRDDAGRLTVAGLDVESLAERHGTAAYVLDEDDFRSRAGAFRDGFAASFERFGGADVYYAGKAFLCTAVARWVDEEGLHLDVCSRGELAVAQRVAFPPERIAFHGNNKTVDELRDGPRVRRRPDRRRLLRRDRPPRRPRGRARGPRPGDGAGHRRGRGAHPRVHRHGARGPEVRLQPRRVDSAMEAVARLLAHPEAVDLRGLHSHIGSQIFDTGGFEAAVHRLVGLHAAVETEHGVSLPEIDLGGGYGIAYTSQHTPLPARRPRRRDGRHRRARVHGRSATATPRACRGSRSSRVARSSGPSTFTLYEVGTVKRVDLGRRARAHLRRRSTAG